VDGRAAHGADAAQLVAFYQDGKGGSLRYLDGPWMVLSSGQARYAYAWALAVVETIEADSGSDGLDRLIDAERTESSGENAMLQALRTNYSSLTTLRRISSQNLSAIERTQHALYDFVRSAHSRARRFEWHSSFPSLTWRDRRKIRESPVIHLCIVRETHGVGIDIRKFIS